MPISNSIYDILYFGTIREEENEDFEQTPMQSNNIFKQLGKAKREELNKELGITGNDDGIDGYGLIPEEEVNLSEILHEHKKRGRTQNVQNTNLGNYLIRGQSGASRRQHKQRGRSVQSDVQSQENSFSGQGGVFEQSMMSLDSSSTCSEQQQIHHFSTHNLCLKMEQEEEQNKLGTNEKNDNERKYKSSLTRDNLEKLIKQDHQLGNSQKKIEIADENVIEHDQNEKKLGIHEEKEEQNQNYDELTLNQKIAEIDRIQNELNKKSKELAEREKLIKEQETKVLAERQEMQKLKDEFAKMEQRMLKAMQYIPEDREEEESYSQYQISLKQAADKLQQNIQQKEITINALTSSQLYRESHPQGDEKKEPQVISDNNNNQQTSVNITNNAKNSDSTSAPKNESSNKKIEVEKKSLNEDQVLKEGWLYKKKTSFFKSWKLRYFVLTTSKVQYYKEEAKKKLRGCINLRIATCRVSDIQGELFTLEIEGYKRKFELKSSAKYTTQEWVNLLHIAINQNEQLLKPCISTLKMNQYFKQDLLTEDQFIQTAQSGDILLFETNNIAAKFQRKFTGSKYDHVGLCLKMGEYDIRVFDSSYGEGVSLSDWSSFIKVNDLYEKVCIRRLEGTDRKLAHEKLISFILENIGKKYQFNLKKILKIVPKDKKGREIDPQGFFCSELVAKYLKNIDLLPQCKPSSYYWPITFCEEKSLQLRNGAFLGEEQVIVLNRHRNRNKEEMAYKEARSQSSMSLRF